MLAPVYWRPGLPVRAWRALMARHDGDGDELERPGPEAPRDSDGGLDGAPPVVRLSVQVLIIVVALAVWAYSVKVRVDLGEPPEPLTFGILPIVVALAYGRAVARWWKDPRK